ncbi:S-layer homology domain-containing protein [Paenibacillus sp. J5C_2022]|nr:S-layer homology domain-containing protein [Paenibacillus sp. J5C2022]
MLFSAMTMLPERFGGPTVVKAASPTIITTAAQLDNVRNNLSGSYRLGANIDLSGYSNWVPIGDNSHPFIGTFDGGGYTISHVSINNSTFHTGFFGYVGGAGTIKNVGLTSVNVSGTGYVGGLVGKSFGTITNAYVSGSVKSTGSNVPIGGLAGLNYGTITNAFATGIVRGGSASNAGGIVGDNESSISNVYFTGIVSVGSGKTGGVVGYNHGSVSDSYTNLSPLSGYNVAGYSSVTGSSVESLSNMELQSTYSTWNFSTTTATVEPSPPFSGNLNSVTISGTRGAAITNGNKITYNYLENTIGTITLSDSSGHSQTVSVSAGQSMVTVSSGAFQGLTLHYTDHNDNQIYQNTITIPAWGISEGKTTPYLRSFSYSAPTVSFGTNGSGTSYVQSASSTITVHDAGSGVNAGSLEYVWTQDASTPGSGATWTSFTSGAVLTKSSGDGAWHLHIQAKDSVGNTVNTSSNAFQLDNAAPTVIFGTNGSGTSYVQSASSTVTVNDAGSGVNASFLKYVWTQDASTPDGGTTWKSFTDGDTLMKGGLDGEWYLHIQAKDEVGNTTDVATNRFDLDNTAPTVSFGTNGNSTYEKLASTTVSVSDHESGVDAGTLQYAWTQSASVPDSGWSTFASGDTLTQAGGDGSWYLHIGATDQAGNVQSQVSNPFELDNTKPAVTLSSAAGGTVNAAFPITVTFSEAASGFDESDIVVGNGTVSNFVSVTATVYSAVINPIASGQAVTVTVPAEVVTDAAGNGNEATTVSYLYDTTKPAVVFDGFTANQIFTTPPTYVTVTVSEAVYWAADGAELTSSNASALISVEKDGEPFSNYTPSYDELSRTYTLTFNGTLGDGVYEVKVAGNVVENNIHNTLDAASMSFTIAVPNVTGISASPAIFSSDGGNAAVAMIGSNLTGQSIKVYVDGAEAATANVASAASAAATVAIPQNATTSDVIHTLTVYLNGVEVADQSATVTVSGKSIASNSSGTVSRPFIDNNGVLLDPDTIDSAKPSVTLEATPKDGVIYVSLPASVLTRFEGNNAAFIIKIQASYGSYQVPVNLASLIPGLKELLAATGLRAEDISFKITLTDKSGDRGVQTAFASDLPKGEVMGAIVDFRIDILNPKTGQTIGTADQFSKALTRMIPMPKHRSGMPSQWGAFRYNEETGKFDFVSARSMRIDDMWYVMINSHSNSVYVVADNAVGFTDIQKHWAQSYVELAAAKGLVNGVGSGKYSPDKAVTRAEFTSMLVRALGRGTSTGITEPYDDVKSGTWYYGDVSTAKELGLLDFVSGTSFKPDQMLTRMEMASMLAAVIALEQLPFTKERVSMDGYKDIKDIDEAYLEDVRLMVKLQIMTGIDADTFSPKGETTRAQAAVVFIRTMRTLGMIDG